MLSVDDRRSVRILNEGGGRCTSRLGLEVVCFLIVVLKCIVACKLSDVTNRQNRQIVTYACKASLKLQCSYTCLYLCKCLKKNWTSPVWQCQRWSFLQEDTVDKSGQLSSEPSWRGALELHATGTAHDWTNKPFHYSQIQVSYGFSFRGNFIFRYIIFLILFK